MEILITDDYWGTTAGTSPVYIVRYERSEASKFAEECRVAGALKEERTRDSQRIAAALEPKPMPLALFVPRTFRPLRQPPGRFPLYQGEF